MADEQGEGRTDSAGASWGGRWVDLRSAHEGSRLRLRDGRTAEVTANPMDGYWVEVRLLDPGGGEETEMVFVGDVAEVVRG